jgi:hypothetical protein
LESFAPLLHERPAPVLSFPKRLRFEAHHNLAEWPAGASVTPFTEELAAERSRYRSGKIPTLMSSLEISGIGHANPLMVQSDGTASWHRTIVEAR